MRRLARAPSDACSVRRHRMNRILFSRRILVLAAFILIGLSSANFSRAAKPVILDTDIGTDIDDSWALALLLRSPEVSVKLVVTETGDTEYRAKVAAKFLERVAQASVPVGIGVNEGPMPEERKNLAPWISD